MKDEHGMTIPNPGSDAAIRAGCICAVMDNNHGKHLPWTGGWWITGGCPIHDKPGSHIDNDTV